MSIDVHSKYIPVHIKSIYHLFGFVVFQSLTHLVAAFLLWDSISCFRQSIPSMVSGSESAPPLLGKVAEGSRREDASPLSLPGPLTDSDSEPCVPTTA